MANTRKPKSLAEITAEAKPKREIVAVCVSGDLVTEHARKSRELDELETKSVGRSSKLSDPDAAAREEHADRLAAEIRGLEQRIEDRTYDFEFEKIEDPGWFDLMDQHPPRKGKEREERWNPHTFPQAAVQASCVSPEGMDDDETFKAFWKALNDGQRDDLFRGARAANEVALSIPFSVSASARQRTSGKSSAT